MRLADVVLCTLHAKYSHASLGLRCLLANLGPLASSSVLMERTISERRPTSSKRCSRTSPRSSASACTSGTPRSRWRSCVSSRSSGPRCWWCSAAVAAVAAARAAARFSAAWRHRLWRSAPSSPTSDGEGRPRWSRSRFPWRSMAVAAECRSTTVAVRTCLNPPRLLLPAAVLTLQERRRCPLERAADQSASAAPRGVDRWAPRAARSPRGRPTAPAARAPAPPGRRRPAPRATAPGARRRGGSASWRRRPPRPAARSRGSSSTLISLAPPSCVAICARWFSRT